MICGNCGTELPDESKFCYSCGEKLEAEPANKRTAETDVDTVKKICERASYLYEDEEYDKAITEYTKALELDPDCQDACKCRGDCYLETGKLDEALADLNKAVRLDTGDAFAFSYRGQVYQKKGVSYKALDDFNKAIKLKPDEWSFYDDRAGLYMEQKVYTSAIEDYTKELKIFFADKDNKESNKATIARLLHMRGEAYYENGKYKAARKDYAEALRYVGFWFQWRDKGRVELELKNYKAAISDYGAAINRYDDGDNEVLANLYYWQGVAHDSKGNNSQALDCMKEAVNLDPDNEGYEKYLKALKRGNRCFITTAVCGSFSKPDNCRELIAFRKFRDNWLCAQPGGKEVITRYYRVAPGIVTAINKSPKRTVVYRDIWDTYLSECLRLIEGGEFEACRQKYTEMVENLEREWIRT
jgi:tetratricopeptide (TPR) repeat protein